MQVGSAAARGQSERACWSVVPHCPCLATFPIRRSNHRGVVVPFFGESGVDNAVNPNMLEADMRPARVTGAQLVDHLHCWGGCIIVVSRNPPDAVGCAVGA